MVLRMKCPKCNEDMLVLEYAIGSNNIDKHICLRHDPPILMIKGISDTEVFYNTYQRYLNSKECSRLLGIVSFTQHVLTELTPVFKWELAIDVMELESDEDEVQEDH